MCPQALSTQPHSVYPHRSGVKVDERGAAGGGEGKGRLGVEVRLTSDSVCQNAAMVRDRSLITRRGGGWLQNGRGGGELSDFFPYRIRVVGKKYQPC